MATIDNREMISRLIENGGYYSKEDTDSPDNPRAEKIVEYTNAAGRRVWGIAFNGDGDINRYLEATAYVQNPVEIWNPHDGLIKEPIEEQDRSHGALESIVEALGLHIESEAEALEKVDRINEGGKAHATLFNMPENPTPEIVSAYTILAMADMDKVINLMKAWNMGDQVLNPKMNAILYAHILSLANSFCKVAHEMEEMGITDGFERNLKIIKGYSQLLPMFYEECWRTRNERKVEKS